MNTRETVRCNGGGLAAGHKFETLAAVFALFASVALTAFIVTHGGPEASHVVFLLAH